MIKCGRKAVWVNRALLTQLDEEKEVYRRRKQLQASWEEYGDISEVYRNGVAKVKAYFELKLSRDVEIHKKGFFWAC